MAIFHYPPTIKVGDDMFAHIASALGNTCDDAWLSVRVEDPELDSELHIYQHPAEKWDEDGNFFAFMGLNLNDKSVALMVVEDQSNDDGPYFECGEGTGDNVMWVSMDYFSTMLGATLEA